MDGFLNYFKNWYFCQKSSVFPCHHKVFFNLQATNELISFLIGSDPAKAVTEGRSSLGFRMEAERIMDFPGIVLRDDVI